MSQEGDDSSGSSGTTVDAAAQQNAAGDSQQPTPDTAPTADASKPSAAEENGQAPQQSPPAPNVNPTTEEASKPSSPAQENTSPSEAPTKDEGASSTASEALKASKEEEEKNKAKESASEVVEKGGLIAGKFQISFTESYTHLQTNQLYIEGFGILPIVVVGNIDVQNVRRDIFTSVLGASYKLTDKMQVSLSVPWQYSMASISTANGIQGRKAAGANTEKTSQSGSLGDITAGMFYQLTREGLNMPSLSGGLNFKARNGRDFFETPDPAAHVPAGTGFYSLQATLSASKTSAPAVVYGSLGYGYNFSRRNIAYTPANASAVLIQSYEPGASVSISAGVSLSLNYQLSLNWAVAEATQFASRLNGSVSPNSATNAITFRMGGIWRISEKTLVDLSLTTGLSSDAGGTTIALRLPWSY